MSTRTLKLTIATLTATFLLGATAFAAPPAKPAKPAPPAARGEERRGPSDEDKAERQKRMKEGRARLLRKRVGLAEDKAKQVEAVMDRFQKERQEKMKAQHEATKKLRELVKADSADQAAYTKALADVEAAHAALTDVMTREKAELKKLLAPKEQARLTLALFKLMKHSGRGHHGGGHGGGHRAADDGDD